ncbi:uncharacterized protein LOC116293578 [Actinia tenebrosa]|uniref:Uncharacterized protein LOC116293578 n=1 Tax=Actinia tenebrosa TaxID=6105 RepID=A0A6P8HWC7_ACTTE|nr:uncharacterized protein LOC116293578 [Actinia tenebrosa]
MASLARKALAVALLVIPVITLAYRPFHIPSNLFTPGLKDANLPEGVREISIQTSDINDESMLNSDELWSDRRSHRSRRAAPSSPPLYVESDLPEENHEVLYKSWPGDTIILLAKNKIGAKTSNVYISVNFGRNWTNINSKLLKDERSNAVIDQIYVSKVNPKLCILTDVINGLLFVTTDYKTFTKQVLSGWKPSFLTFHPTSQNRIMGYDKTQKKLYLSTNTGSSFKFLSDQVRAFWWGVEGTDPETTIFVDKLKTSGGKSTAIEFNDSANNRTLLDNIDEFEVMKNYMFATQTYGGKIKLMVSYNRKSFVETKFPVTESNRDYFVFDIVDDQVFVIINHQKNESNMYISNTGGTKYTLSIPRVLYHNPYTDVSSPWLRTTVTYAFVDIHKVKSMRGVYVATQLTPGPVGRRHLLSLITYNKGGSWGRIRSPTRDVNNQPIYCYLPSCSLHFNLLYGSVYRISPSEDLLSSTSAPGLVMALGVASTNLKIHPDMFMSTDGGLNWKRVLRGKHQYSFGDHGGVIVATYFRRYTKTLKYSVNGGENWQVTQFSPRNILVQDIITQDDQKLPVFLVYGTPSGRKKSWKIYHFNMTSTLGAPCQSEDFMEWIPSDDRVGYERCILGRQEHYMIRNWTRTCYLGNNYIGNVKSINKCACTRSDYECDFGFERNASHPNCVPVPREDLNNDLIPKDCKEGSTYKRSSGYRKIPGDTCVGGEDFKFFPVDTPCPVEDLSGLVVSTSPSKKPLGVAPNTAVTFNASFTKTAYLPNINFRWDFGDDTSSTGIGKNAAVVTHKFKTSGHYVVVVTATNTKSILIARVEVYVEETLQPSNVVVTFSPVDPTVVQPITFLANLVGLTRESAGHLTYEWFVNGKSMQKGFQAIFIHSFNKSISYDVDVKVSNMVGSAKKKQIVSVSKDITPLGVKAEAQSPTSVFVSWQPPLESSLYITGFKVFKSVKTKSGFTEAAAVSSIQFSKEIINLLPSTTYYFKVMAFTSAGDGPFSDIVSATTNASAPAKPKNVRGYAMSSTSIGLEWSPPDNDYGRVTSYKIRWWPEPDLQNRMTKVVDRSTRKVVFDKLKQDTVYYFEMITVSSLGESSPEGPLAVRSNISKPGYPPRNFKQFTNNGTCVFLMWEAPYMGADKQRLFPAKGYKLYVNNQLRSTTSEKTKLLCNLNPGQTYNFKVSAYSVMGEGPKASLYITVRVMLPTSPRSFTATAKTSRIIMLRWEAPSSPNGKLLNYAIYQLLPPSTKKPIGVPPSKTSYEVTGLEPYTRYEFIIVANNSAGVSKPSDRASAMTQEEIPDAPKFVTAELVKPESNTIRLSWSQPQKPNGKITGYMISWGKTSVSDSGDKVGKHQNIIGNVLTFTFKHLYSKTEYSFSVRSKNGAGQSLSFSKPAKQYTQQALEGTKRLEIQFQGQKDTAADSFPDDFIDAVRRQARIPSERVAALFVKAIAVEFEILPILIANGKSVDQVITVLNSSSFSVGSGKTVTGSVKVLRVYGKASERPTTGAPGVVGKRVGTQESSKSQNLALIIVLTVVGLLLLAVLVFGVAFYYRKYKSLERHYSTMSSSIYRARDDELNVIYPGEVTDERNDRELLDKDSKSKNRSKNVKEEKMRLGDHDELALI